MTDAGFIALSASIAILTCLGAGVGLGIASYGVAQSVSRNPEAGNKVMTYALIFATLAEVTAIFGFVISIILTGKI
jgi:F-type H+-transporting ATPase subunit c